jgi:heme oxygenase (biliverdin-IX-beta and delta-forming)
VSLALRLKRETASAHARIERELDLPRRIGSAVSYRRLLERFHGFHAEWEARARRFLAAEPIFAGRWKTALLEADLRTLGMDESAIAGLARCSPLMRLSHPADAWGAAYVVEGSTLGGAVIAKAVRRHLGFTADRGCAYFAGYGRHSAARWRIFTEKLDLLASPEIDERVIASALATFERMRTWLAVEAAQAKAA